MKGALRSAAVTVSVASGSLLSPPLAAEGSDPFRPTRNEDHVTHGMAELGVGLLTLPSASFCVAEGVGCSKGDSSLAVSAWPLFRRGAFAAGAGVTLGLTSSTDTPRNDPPSVPRDHTRRYFAVEAGARYYIPLTERLDGFGGITSGLGVVNDTFKSQRLSEKAVVGPRGVTLLTEGFTLGVGAGLAYAIADNWRFGGGMRVSSWFLPEEPQRDPLGDEASLKGRVTTVDLNLTIAYRSRLVF